MKKDEEAKDKTRNNNFAAAVDYLRRNTGIKTQQELAKRMGVSKDTITRIMKAYTPFTEEAISKFQTATDCIFNLQWLRGESDIMMAEDAGGRKNKNPHESTQHDTQNIAEELLREANTALKGQVAAMTKTIESQERELGDKEKIIRMQEQRIAELEATLSFQKTNEKSSDRPGSGKTTDVRQKPLV